ncbi:intersectin-1 [Methylorubrum populi]|uniref:Intersectin-1 n=1 Tax=Methylorubrum populi TaxID=223967 RepID=A0A160PKW1_9HYPH|nr:hypothetical protein [Methylorubrum populi]BAU92871.1 intersectin-1 [Methylorubrum populi]
MNSFGIDARLPTVFDSPPRPENTGRGGPFRPPGPAPNASPGKLCRFAHPAVTLPKDSSLSRQTGHGGENSKRLDENA